MDDTTEDLHRREIRRSTKSEERDIQIRSQIIYEADISKQPPTLLHLVRLDTEPRTFREFEVNVLHITPFCPPK